MKFRVRPWRKIGPANNCLKPIRNPYACHSCHSWLKTAPAPPQPTRHFCQLNDLHVTDERLSLLRYRLPTEAEWEFACRAGTTTLFHTGNDPATLTDAAWIFEENGRYPKPVGSKQPNAFGLSDMHENVSEWVHDAWQPDFYQLSRDAGAVDPRCDTGIDERRIVRGGNYVFSWAEARSACREAYWAKSDRYWVNGFRVALSVEAVAALRSVGR